jgi:cell division protein FtsW
VYTVAFAVPAALGLTQGYRLERLLSFTHPWDDYYGSGYQIIHSMYAFAQGGLFGTGLGNSAEKYLYLPEASTDFIFAVIGEEMGLVGSLLVLGLFVALLLGGLRMAQAAPDRFGGVLCGAFAIIIVFQAFLNMGCVIGVLPITGKPLPFVSAGGSSLIASLIMVGIMLSVSFASGEPRVYRERREEIHPVGWDDYGRERTTGRYRGYASAALPPRSIRGAAGASTRMRAYPGDARYRQDRERGAYHSLSRGRGR